mgnify:CR=1 FL=1
MTEPDTSIVAAEPAAPPTRGCPRRWIAATLAGMGAGVPIGWLLSNAAMLPFYLGLFFFALLGLLVGAVQFRVGRPLAPVARPTLLVGGLLTVATTWFVSIAAEYLHLYDDVHRFAWTTFRTLDDATLRQIREIPARVHENLRTSYPPGGLIGYMRWASRSGRMDVATMPSGRPLEFRLRQGPLGWTLRVAICAGLLTFGIMSQVMALANPPKKPEPTEPDPAPPAGTA